MIPLGAERILARCRELAQISDVDGQTTRTFLSPAMRRANALVGSWMREAGLTVRVDAAGNLLGRSHPEPELLLGSHLDTVVDAGGFDGPLGVLLAIEAAASVPHAKVEIAGFSDEEGVRFGVPFLGSRALAGTLDAAALALRDRSGISVAEAIAGFGLPVAELPQATLAPSLRAYLEVHIEQGPLLEAEDRALAAVSAIAGQTRLRIVFAGQANHAGTTPMPLRQDALAAAAEWIGRVEAEARATSGLVATVGSVQAEPGLGNVIPGRVTCSLDVRHADDTTRMAAVNTLLAAAEQAGSRRRVSVSQECVLEQAVVPMHPGITERLVACAALHGLNGLPMPSGAGHDAMILAPHLPSAMLFVRSPGGISHSPAETVRQEDVAAALAVTIKFLRNIETLEREWNDA